MKIHKIKVDAAKVPLIREGVLTAINLKNARGYSVGDFLHIQEWWEESKTYGSWEGFFQITFVMLEGLMKSWASVGIKPVQVQTTMELNVDTADMDKETISRILAETDYPTNRIYYMLAFLKLHPKFSVHDVVQIHKP